MKSKNDFFFSVAKTRGRKYLWRAKYSQLMPGNKPKFLDILGDAKEFFILDNSPNKHLWQKKFFDVLRRRTEKYGRHQLFCIWLAYMPFVVIVKAEGVKEYFEKKMNKKYFLFKWMEPALGTGLLTSEFSKWKPRRKLLMPCFHSDILQGFLPVFNEYSQKLVDFLQEETMKEFTLIETIVSNITLDIICDAMFGVKIEDLGNMSSEYVKSYRRFAQIFMLRFFKLWNWPDCIFKMSKEGKEMMHHLEIFHAFIRKIIQEKKKRYLNDQRDQNIRKRMALLDLLLDKHIERGELNEEDIREEVATFAVGGHETVSTAIGWVLYLIGLHRDVQTKLHEELDKVFGEDTTRPVLKKDLSGLQYLDCVVKETLRLYPSAPIFGRETQEDTNICGHIIPKGTSCVISTYSLHRDEDVFPDPERFDPERFSFENSLKIPEYSYLPFSAGPRSCIGQRFAMMEIKVIISSILRNFSIESLDARDKMKPLIYITLHPSSPIRLRIRPRA
ncbi:unnamed protein product [Larinioides sclopetarius]|uniref:Cytochrome P450 n=1 Tax=Larinioides sclopetarius TaxID=280406 RepID=A0AAV2ANX6_9ARAC